MGTLCKNGKRAYTRGWTGAKWVKRQTSKRSRRLANTAIRCNDGESVERLIRGWVW
jgi:hypothetical protein